MKELFSNEPISTVSNSSGITGFYSTSGTNTVWDNLLAEIRFAGCSRPERSDAILRIQYAIDHLEMRDWHKEVLSGIILVLNIDPRA